LLDLKGYHLKMIDKVNVLAKENKNISDFHLNRIIDVFPPEQQGQIRAQLAESLNMVVTQKLFKKKDGTGRVGAFEVMFINRSRAVQKRTIHP